MNNENIKSVMEGFMNKRILSIMLVLSMLFCSVAFSAPETIYVQGSIPEGGASCNLPVQWVLSTDDIIEVGFSKTEVTRDNTTVTPVDTLNLSNGKDITAENIFGEGEVYVYWKIASYEGLNVELKVDSALQLLGDESTTLDWQAVWNSKDLNGFETVQVSGTTDSSDAEGAYTAFKPVYKQGGSSTGLKTKIGSTRVVMTTANANEKTEGIYNSKLTVKVTSAT